MTPPFPRATGVHHYTVLGPNCSSLSHHASWCHPDCELYPPKPYTEAEAAQAWADREVQP